MSDKKTISAEELALLKEIKGKNYSLTEIKEFLKGLERKDAIDNETHKIGKSSAKFVAFGDPHIGNIAFKKGFAKFMVDYINNSDVDFVACTGDIADGWYQNRPSSIFEQYAIGFDNQMRESINTFKNLKKPLYFITGNHTYNTFVRGAGVEFGPYFERGLKDCGVDAHYLGNAEGNIKLKNGSTIKLLHPDGGTAYAISYKSQKIVESFGGGEKPNILLVGHFHKAEYIFYRNVHTVQTATLCGQTKFMRGKGIPAHVGFWEIETKGKGDGSLDSITATLFPKYD